MVRVSLDTCDQPQPGSQCVAGLLEAHLAASHMAQLEHRDAAALLQRGGPQCQLRGPGQLRPLPTERARDVELRRAALGPEAPDFAQSTARRLSEASGRGASASASAGPGTAI